MKRCLQPSLNIATLPPDLFKSLLISSPDIDDHLTLKRLKVLHSQESKSQTLVQTSTLVQLSVIIQPILSQPITTQPILSQPINTQPILSQSTTLAAISTPLFEVVDIEEYDEEQGLQSLQTSIFNEISSPPNQATIIPTLPRAGPSEQLIAEQPIKDTSHAQPEQMVSEHIIDNYRAGVKAANYRADYNFFSHRTITTFFSRTSYSSASYHC